MAGVAVGYRGPVPSCSGWNGVTPPGLRDVLVTGSC